MSTYYTIDAEIIYRTPEALEKAVKPLRQGGWLKDDNTLVSEDSMLADPGNPVVIDGCVLRLPQALYRNLGRVIDEVFFVGAIGGYYKEFCEDGCFRIKSYIFNDEGDAGDVSYDYALEADLDGGELLDDELLDCLSDGKTKDTLLLDLEEWSTKYGYKDSEQAEDDYYTERSNAGAEIFSSM